MSIREWIFAVLLAVAGALVVAGVARWSVTASMVTAGVLLAGWGWLVLGDSSGPGGER